VKPYLVTIYEVDEDQEEEEPWSEPSFSGAYILRVLASSERHAAAKAFVKAVGRTWARKLTELKAPKPCVCSLVNTRWLAGSLRKETRWSGDSWRLDHPPDTPVKTWYIELDALNLPQSVHEGLRARRASRLSRLWRAFQSPPTN
jgi:hypothetical protein